MKPTLAIAPHFHLAGGWADRLLVADGELSAVVREPRTREELAGCVCLFSIPAHLRSSFWAMLARQASESDGDFVAFAQEVARFLSFKQLPPPAGSAFELVLHPAGGPYQGAGLWGVVNLGEGPTFVAWPGLRLRLAPGEGCRLAGGAPPEVLPPDGEEPDVLLVIREGEGGE